MRDESDCSMYLLQDSSSVVSPGLLFYPALIRKNIARALEMVGDPRKLRPHVKTHKTREITRLELEQGITRHKCATVAEAEMLADCGAAEVLLAYPPVGPNCHRMARLVQAFPGCRFAVLVDHPQAARALSEVLVRAGQQVEILLDLNVGMHRTGIEPGEQAIALYELVDCLPGLRPGGLHAYDGHNDQQSLAERQAAVERLLEQVLAVRSTLEKKGLPVPRLVLGGTPTFEVYARLNLPGLECSPGTLFLNDYNYSHKFPGLAQFTCAALLLTRVVSRPAPNRVTLDLGYKAVASDPPAGHRCHLLNVPEYKTVLQNEEHLAFESPLAGQFSPGDEVYAIPAHICPTCALHRHAYVVENGQVTGRWEIAARDRMLTI